MKVIFEFDTDSELFEPAQLEEYKQTESMAVALGKITDLLRTWYKYDERDCIPTEEIRETIMDIINRCVNLEKIGYC